MPIGVVALGSAAFAAVSVQPSEAHSKERLR